MTNTIQEVGHSLNFQNGYKTRKRVSTFRMKTINVSNIVSNAEFIKFMTRDTPVGSTILYKKIDETINWDNAIFPSSNIGIDILEENNQGLS